MIASKSKRLLLENGAVKADIGPEWSSGTIWYRSKYVSNAVIIVPPGTGGQVIFRWERYFTDRTTNKVSPSLL